MRIYEELEQWWNEFAYYNDPPAGKKCPTPKGVKRYIDNLLLAIKTYVILKKRNEKLKITVKGHIDKLYNKITKQMATIMALEKENHKLKIKVERLKKGLKVI